jgi:hypothetical protein
VKNLGFNMTLARDSGSVGRNYELGIVKHCPNKSFAVVLKREEAIAGEKKLHQLAENIAPHEVLGTFVALRVGGQMKVTQTYYEYYNKVVFNGNKPRYG